MKLSVDLAKALVTQWNIGGDLLHAVLQAEPDFPPNATSEQWDMAYSKHGLTGFHVARQSVRHWIAHHFAKANDCLWDGKQELAWKWMASGKDHQTLSKKRPWTEAKKAMRSHIRSVKFISVRGSDKSHDWSTCK